MNDTTVNRAIDDAVAIIDFAKFPRNAGYPEKVEEHGLKLYRSSIIILR
ncbi:hypothetical protein NDI49_06360 [Trichocoleus sp. ST-U3]|nr:hypothetical protein [Coleofasciculus sp. FACHB-542]MBD2086345.1 hypothetical protein [Coleofasciculus sp. FACHB-542]